MFCMKILCFKLNDSSTIHLVEFSNPIYHFNRSSENFQEQEDISHCSVIPTAKERCRCGNEQRAAVGEPQIQIHQSNHCYATAAHLIFMGLKVLAPGAYLLHLNFQEQGDIQSNAHHPLANGV